MKKLLLGSLVFILASFISTGAGALTIDDSTYGATTYYGGTIHPSPSDYDDYIGGSFRVTSLTATQAGGMTEVKLVGPYFATDYATGNGGETLGRPGDLYISTGGWKVNSPNDHARADKFEKNEGWNYVVSFGQLKVYNLNFDNIIFSSNEGDEWGDDYRSDQAFKDGYGSILFDVNVGRELNSNLGNLSYLRFMFPDLGNVETMGYHWTMACGNDVVEGGGTPIPEPATMLLLGSGLIGLAGYARKRFKR